MSWFCIFFNALELFFTPHKVAGFELFPNQNKERRVILLHLQVKMNSKELSGNRNKLYFYNNLHKETFSYDVHSPEHAEISCL